MLSWEREELAVGSWQLAVRLMTELVVGGLQLGGVRVFLLQGINLYAQHFQNLKVTKQ